MAVTVVEAGDDERGVVYEIGLSANGDVAQAQLAADDPEGLLWQARQGGMAQERQRHGDVHQRRRRGHGGHQRQRRTGRLGRVILTPTP